MQTPFGVPHRHMERRTPEVENAVAADSCTATSRIAAATTAIIPTAMHADMKLRIVISN